MAQIENFNLSEAENEYITTKITLTEMSKKYGVSYGRMREWSRNNEWTKKRKEYLNRVKEKSLKKIEEKVIDKKARLYSDNLNMVDELQKLISKKIISMKREKIEEIKEANLLSMAKSVATLNALVIDNTNIQNYDSIEKLDSLIKTIKGME